MELNKELLKMGKQIVELQKQMYKIAESEANYIIQNKIIDDMKIQRALDGLLEFCEDERVLSLYRKLCKYYYNINPVATANYIKYYREEYDPDGLKFGGK